jgi:hypothetical protein
MPQPLHPEIRSVVHLNLAHAHKIYFSGPLVRHIERQADGQRPVKDDGWVDVWAQLVGTTLSVWDMKEIADASKQEKEVPPTHVNVTDVVRNFFLVVHTRADFAFAVCASPWLRNRPSYGFCACKKVFQCAHA